MLTRWNAGTKDGGTRNASWVRHAHNTRQLRWGGKMALKTGLQKILWLVIGFSYEHYLLYFGVHEVHWLSWRIERNSVVLGPHGRKDVTAHVTGFDTVWSVSEEQGAVMFRVEILRFTLWLPMDWDILLLPINVYELRIITRGHHKAADLWYQFCASSFTNDNNCCCHRLTRSACCRARYAPPAIWNVVPSFVCPFTVRFEHPRCGSNLFSSFISRIACSGCVAVLQTGRGKPWNCDSDSLWRQFLVTNCVTNLLAPVSRW
jgi:hypothetical protein